MALFRLPLPNIPSCRVQGGDRIGRIFANGRFFTLCSFLKITEVAQIFTNSSGVDVMITIFCDFYQFSAKNGVFLKYQYYDQLFSKFSFVLSQKHHFFADKFGENILKIIASVPGHPECMYVPTEVSMAEICVCRTFGGFKSKGGLLCLHQSK
jgi:hypothetical protein